MKTIVFDVFGTVVDWRSSMIKEFTPEFKKKHILSISPEHFVDTWVTSYSDNIALINAGKIPFATIDDLNRKSLDIVLKKFRLFHFFNLQERHHLSLVWHRLNPWPDSIIGLQKLRKKFIVGTLSNGNMKLLVELSKHAQLDWDCIVSAQFFRKYKPNPIVYEQTAELFNLKPNEMMLVASHPYDLRAAKKCGYHTALINRPEEFGSHKRENIFAIREFDFYANGIDELAKMLGTVDNLLHRP